MPMVTIPALTTGTELTFTLTVTGRGTTNPLSEGSGAPGTDTATVTVSRWTWRRLRRPTRRSSLQVGVAIGAMTPSTTDTDIASYGATGLPPGLGIDAIAGDNTVNIAEKAAGFSIGGATGTESGVSVTVTVGSTTLAAATSATGGAWSVAVPANIAEKAATSPAPA